MSTNKTCILLTGTISPGLVPNLKRVDPLEREKDYYYAIKEWLRLELPLVFVENSNYESELINSLFKNQSECEYIRFESKTSYLGKSHGEAEILKYAFDNSDIVKSSKIVIKSSGRQYITNSLRIIDAFHELNVSVMSWLKQYLQYADSRFFIGNKDFYINYLFTELDLIDETKSVYLEHALARAIHRCIADGKCWSLPSEYPICKGISGTNNVKYENSFFGKIKGNIIIKLTNRLLKNDYL